MEEKKPNILLNNKSLGEILIDLGEITRTDVRMIEEYQKEKGLLFGEAAVKLKLAGQDKVTEALSQQFSHAYLGKGDDSLSPELLAAYQPFCAKVDAMREVRTTLLLSGVGEMLISLCVTGCGEGVESSSFAANLAILFAQQGRKTLLMDFDLRTPGIHQLFKINNSIGVSTLLINRSSLEETVQSTVFEKLDILPSGPVPPNPLELITRKEGSDLMETLKKSYEIVIVNTCSFERVADVSYLSSYMDGLIMVVLNRKTRKAELKRSQKILDDLGIRILGVVLNT
ncbi:MAG: CpsD/CapB family tyrosine-protein kinase [bacterium]